MNWAWLLLVLAASALVNWPWLLLLVALSWVLQIGHGPSSPGVLIVPLMAALVAEAFLVAASRRVHASNLGTTVLEGTVLGAFALLWGTIVGLIVWQVSLGFDAIARMRTLQRSMVRLLIIRGARMILGTAFVVLYAHGW